jgi:hypothetical protein
MRTLDFDRFVTVTNFYSIEILDEELFKIEVLDWIKKEGLYALWRFDNEHFTSVKVIECNKIDYYEEDCELSVSILEQLNIDPELLVN